MKRRGNQLAGTLAERTFPAGTVLFLISQGDRISNLFECLQSCVNKCERSATDCQAASHEKLSPTHSLSN